MSKFLRRVAQYYLLVLSLIWLPGAMTGAAFAQGNPFDADAAPRSSAPAAAPVQRDLFSAPSVAADAQTELLPPEQAFRLAVRARDPDTLIALLTPASGHYLYRDRITFSIVSPASVAVANLSLPKGEAKADPTFGTVEVYHRPFEAIIALRHTGERPDKVDLRAGYQGCNELLGVCYPPIEKTITVALSDLAAAAPVSQSEAPAAPGLRLPDASDAGAIRELFARGGTWGLLAAFFGFGILLAFTPCMLPMIPILSGILVGQDRATTRRQAVGLSAIYVFAMAITYAVAGVAAALAGTLLSAYLQNPWVLGSFAMIFVLLALSMFGLYNLQLPAALQNTLVNVRTRGGRSAGAFLMGVLSAIIVGPCVAAPLAGALIYIGQTHDIVLGGIALFSMAIGMGVPLLVVGATTGSLLPRAGAWTQTIKNVFGVGMLAVAIYVASPVMPIFAQQLLWAALLILPAIYMHALDPLPAAAPGYMRLFKDIGVLALLAGAALMAGALSGHREILQPLAGFRSDRGERRDLAFIPVNSVADFRVIGYQQPLPTA